MGLDRGGGADGRSRGGAQTSCEENKVEESHSGVCIPSHAEHAVLQPATSGPASARTLIRSVTRCSAAAPRSPSLAFTSAHTSQSSLNDSAFTATHLSALLSRMPAIGELVLKDLHQLESLAFLSSEPLVRTLTSFTL